MALNDIYVLPSDYPLFDWSDWPDSEAALVPGGFTHEFKKEAWNAIIDHLAVALNEAGETWDSKYTSSDGAKITEAYGALYADAINSICHNIDNAVPVLRWGWAHDRNFRGYIGRKEFRGVIEYGDKGADDVYPEYIFELVRRLNFLIKVMTGEAATVAQGRELSFSKPSVLARSVPSLPLGGIKNISLTNSLGRIDASPSVPMNVREISASKSKAEAMSGQMMLMRPKRSMSRSLYEAKAVSKQRMVVTPEPSLSKSLNRVCIFSGFPNFLEFSKEVSQTISSLTVRPADTIYVKPQDTSTSRGVLDLTQGDSTPIHAYDISEGSSSCVVDRFLSASVAGREISSSPGCAVLGTAWYPPIWENGGLLFTQVQQNATWLEDGFFLLEVCETAAWFEDGLYIMQIENANLKNGVLEVA